MALREIDNVDEESLSSQPPAEDNTRYSYKPGSLRSIKLINFMCHASFELEFGPRVNFVIGPNGSGKSALLTALVVALGGRATTTNRAKRVDDFVMYGKNQAKVIVVLHNYEKASDKYQGFKPEDYGKTITIEKTLLKDGQNRLVLKNDKDKKVSERKSELDEMLDHFGILINNPICILNQEVSKTFLHSKKAEDKFDLFMKATNLEQIEQDYNSANVSHKEWNESNYKKLIVFKLLDKEYNACQEKLGFLLNRGKMLDDKDRLQVELLWGIVRDGEVITNQLEAKVNKIDEAIGDAQANIDSRKEKIKASEEELQLMKNKIESMTEGVDEVRKKAYELRKKETEIKGKHVEVKSKVELGEKKISRLKRDQSSIEKAIDELKQKFRDQNALDQDSEQRKQRMECIRRELPSEMAREKSIRLHSDQLSVSMTSTRGELQSANLRSNELKNKLTQKQALLRRLRNGQDNLLRKFGDAVVKINEEIEKAHKQNKFKVKPLGPIGYYIKLKSPDIAKPLECHLGRNSHAYVCDNHNDMAVLNTIFKKLSMNAHNFRVPVVLTRKFCQRHDVSIHKAVHDTYKTMLDHLDIENEVIFNALVDRCFLECVLFIPDYNEAEHIMINPQLVPRNTRCAYTRECAVMHPKTNTGCYKSFANPSNQFVLYVENNSTEIKETERDIEMINADLRDSENICKSIQESLNAQRREYEENNAEIKKILAEIRSKEEELLQLGTVVHKQPEELSVHEVELEDISKHIVTEQKRLEENKSTMVAIEKDLADIKKDKDDLLEKQKLRESNRSVVEKMVETTRANINDHKQHVKNSQNIIENRMKDKVEESKKLEDALDTLAQSKSGLPQNSNRPTRLAKTEEIRKEIAAIDRQLKADLEEMRDPEELKSSLEARMKEIRDLNSIKRKNEENFELTSRTLKMREDGLDSLRTNTIHNTAMTFSIVMRTMKMNGKLSIYLADQMHDGQIVKKARTLEMNIDTHYTPSQRITLGDCELDAPPVSPVSRRISHSQPGDVTGASRPKRARTSRAIVDTSIVNEKENGMKMTDSRSLSGGERSFSTVAFVLSLWHHCNSPFKLMDEIDVFMDMVTRRVSYNALIRFAQASGTNPGQFVFFSPLELPRIDHAGSFVRVFEMPCIIRKRHPMSQPEVVE